MARTTAANVDTGGSDTSDDFEVTSPDVRHPSTIGISFCVQLSADGCVVIRLPRARRFAWQEETSPPFPLNGRYESCKRRWTDEIGRSQEGPMWRRHPAVPPDCEIVILRSELTPGRPIRRDVTMPHEVSTQAPHRGIPAIPPSRGCLAADRSVAQLDGCHGYARSRTRAFSTRAISRF